ncbi:uncharacterized protein LOC112188992 [Rosa chinensis]|uniref:uncharacterized protein LOC112188992 n=1 Tax=Rosa chinensis TaxID=74649 RepID=UPI000D092511|nr:uncharacterized protein LOC112188992 [Rosa chinensis]
MEYRKTTGTVLKKIILLLFVSEFLFGVALADARADLLGWTAGAIDSNPSPLDDLDRLIGESLINETIAALERGQRPLSGVELLFGDNAEEARKPWCVDRFTRIIPSWVALTDHVDRLIHEVQSGKPIDSVRKRPIPNMNRVRWYRDSSECDYQRSALWAIAEEELELSAEEQAEVNKRRAGIISEHRKLEEKVTEEYETILTYVYVKKIEDRERESEELAKEDCMKVKIDARNKLDNISQFSPTEENER